MRSHSIDSIPARAESFLHLSFANQHKLPVKPQQAPFILGQHPAALPYVLPYQQMCDTSTGCASLAIQFLSPNDICAELLNLFSSNHHGPLACSRDRPEWFLYACSNVEIKTPRKKDSMGVIFCLEQALEPPLTNRMKQAQLQFAGLAAQEKEFPKCRQYSHRD